jgi:hypothetical protein
VYGNATIQYVRDNATIQYVYGNATIQYVYGNATIQDVYGNATIQDVYGNATIQDVYGNALLKIFSSTVKAALHHDAVAICQDCNPIITQTGNAQIIRTQRTRHNINTVLELYKESVQTDGRIALYKSVQPETFTDFWTGKIKYEGIVECPDWDDNPDRECGGGLHLSPTPKLALSYNPSGVVKKCLVALEDFVVFHGNIDKVRCRKVEVVEDEENTNPKR